MEVSAPNHFQIFPPKPHHHLMIAALASNLHPPLFLRRLTPAAFNLFSTAASASTAVTPSPELIVETPEPLTPPNGRRTRVKKSSLDVEQLKLNWLKSLSSPEMDFCGDLALNGSGNGSLGSGWVLGVDPDLSGALAVLKPDNSAEVFDSPHLKIPVGKRLRKRLDVRSIIQLLQSIDAPMGSRVYLEQSIPFPQDGKQGWWSGGFGYGLWIGVLVASGYSVIPVPSFLWKAEFKLSGGRSSKDDSRELAAAVFPDISSSLKRKKDHGRAEALLIAAYGKGLKVDKDQLHSDPVEMDAPIS